MTAAHRLALDDMLMPAILLALAFTVIAIFTPRG
jgi:hypothetical protein